MTTLLKSPQLSEAKRTLHSPSALISEKIASGGVENYLDADHGKNSAKQLDKYLDIENSDQPDGKTQEQQKEIEALKDSLQKALAELDDLKNTLEEEKQQAREQGYNDGVREAKEEISLQLNSRLDDFDAMLKSARKKLDESLENQEDKIVEVIITAIYKVFGELLASNEGILKTVRQVIKGVKLGQPIVVRVSNDDFEVINELRADLVQLHDSEIKIIPDKQVGLGGCIVESAGGNLDGRIEIQLQSLTKALLQAKHSIRQD